MSWYVYTYLEPKWPLFLKVFSPKTRPKLQSKQGSSKGSRYVYMLYFDDFKDCMINQRIPRWRFEDVSQVRCRAKKDCTLGVSSKWKECTGHYLPSSDCCFFPKNAGTLLWRGLTLYNRVLGSPNHQFWDPMILRVIFLYVNFVTFFRDFPSGQLRIGEFWWKVSGRRPRRQRPRGFQRCSLCLPPQSGFLYGAGGSLDLQCVWGCFFDFLCFCWLVHWFFCCPPKNNFIYFMSVLSKANEILPVSASNKNPSTKWFCHLCKSTTCRQSWLLTTASETLTLDKMFFAWKVDQNCVEHGEELQDT